MYSNNAAATTPGAPAAPTGLVARAASSGQISISWTDTSGNEDGFKIDRCTGSSCTSFVQIAQVGANVQTYLNTRVKSGTIYRYRVRSYNANGDSAYSNTVTATAP